MSVASASRLHLRFGLVVALALLASAAFAGPASAAVTTKVIAETAAPFAIAAPNWVSEDGRYVVYEDEGLYVADTVTGISTFIAGAAESGPSISDDGRFVAYVDPTGGTSRAYVWDRTTGDEELVSLTSDEQPMSAAPRGVTISGNGRYVGFLSQDPDSLPPDWGLGNGVFLRDRTGGTTELISATPTHRAWEGEGPGLAPSLSDDGSVAAWSASLLNGPPFFPDPGAGGFGGTPGIVVWERATGDLRLLEQSVDRGVMLSGDGQSALWTGCDPNPNCDGPDRRDGVFVSDIETGTHEFIAPGWSATISDDGRYVSYAHGETENDDDVFRYDREANSPTQVNYNPDGSRAPARSLTGISGDGRNVGFLAGGAPQLLLATFGDGIIRPTLDPQAPPKDAVWGWGYNYLGHFGGSTGDSWLLPGEIGDLTDVDALATGYAHSLALKADGTVWARGYNGYGQLGDGTTSQRNTPVQVSGLTGVDAVAAGYHSSVAVKSDGTVWAWGYNGNGELGDGTTTQRNTPVQVSGLTGVDAVAAGAIHSLAVKSDGTVWAWGYNGSGQLGDGTTTQRNTPVQVNGLTGVDAVAANGGHSLAVKSDGTVWAWGYNGSGQLGDGTTSQRNTPVQVSGLTGVDAVAAGAIHSLAVKANGTVWAWGYNGSGQLGDGTTTQRNTPVQVNGLTGVDAVAAGANHSLAVKSDGTVWAWGSNWVGQLGDNTTVQRNTPVQVRGLTGVDAVAANLYHTVAAGRASPTQGVESFTQALPAGATVTTDVEEDGATPDDPIETTLTTPVAGTVSIAETPSSAPVGGFSVYGRSVQITAPAASAADPIVIRFRLDASIYLSHWPLSSLYVSRNGSTVGDCTGPGASPNPCVEGRTRLPDGDVEVVVRTSAASDWAIGRAGPAANAGGPYTVAEGSKITLNGTATGGQAPLAYRWLGAAGELNDPSKARPTFTGLDDATLTLNLLVTDAAALAGTDDTTVTVTNRPPIVSPLAVDANKNRRLQIAAAFADPGRLDTHTALVRWGDGTQSAARVSERHGIGAAVADHQYARKGTYTVGLTVRDDDGGDRSVERRVDIR